MQFNPAPDVFLLFFPYLRESEARITFSVTRCSPHNGKPHSKLSPWHFPIFICFSACVWKNLNFFTLKVLQIKKSLIYSGEGAPPEDGLFTAHEHLPAAGDWSNAEGYCFGQNHLDRSQTSHRWNHRDERESTGRAGLHVWRPHPCTLEEGWLRVLTKTKPDEFICLW